MKFFLFVMLVFIVITASFAQTVAVSPFGATWKGAHKSTPVFSFDSLPGKISIPKPMFLACQDNYAVVDTSNTVIIDSLRYIFVGNVAVLPQCCYHEDGSLLLTEIHLLSPIEVLNSLTWRKMHFGRPFKSDENYMGNYIPVYVWDEELRKHGLLK